MKGGYRTTAPTTPPAATPSAVTPSETNLPGGELPPRVALEVKEVTVVGTEFSFSPSSITAKAGQKVKITFQNQGGAPHNLVITGLGISTKTIFGGKTDTIEFTAPSSGTFTFFCSVPGHRAAGMEGSLKVE